MEYQEGVSCFIVEVGEKYNREVKKDDGKTIKGSDGKDLILSAQFDDWDNLKTEGKVLATPKCSNFVPLGSTLYFNKTITHTNSRFSEIYEIEKGVFRVPYWIENGRDTYNLAFAYKHNGKLKTFPDWILVEPSYRPAKKIGNIFIPEKVDGKLFFEGEEIPLMGKGKVAICEDNDYYSIGETILFDEGMEYEVIIDNKKYYRVNTEYIFAKEVD